LGEKRKKQVAVNYLSSIPTTIAIKSFCILKCIEKEISFHK
jgi:hypothetical protein